MVNIMSMINYLITKTKAGLETFLKLITLANRSYPYHDYEIATMIATMEGYRVGENNVGRNGTQNKMFISKSTLIMATADAEVTFNSNNNVPILILANTWYTFMCDIRAIYYSSDGEEATIYIYCEGTHTSEGRVAE